jgi:hypothetical protein
MELGGNCRRELIDRSQGIVRSAGKRALLSARVPAPIRRFYADAVIGDFVCGSPLCGLRRMGCGQSG